MNIANLHSTTFFSPAKAEATAAEMNRTEDDGWTYKAKHDPKGTGYSLVEVYDEDGEFVSNI